MVDVIAGIGVRMGHPFGGFTFANVTMFLCKVSEVLNMREATRKEKAKFVALTALAQALGYAQFLVVVGSARAGVI